MRLESWNNYIGKTFGEYKAIGISKDPNSGHNRIIAQCGCGKITNYMKLSRLLKEGNNHCFSCSLKKHRRNLKHGLSKTPEYYSWCSAFRRCFKVHSSDYYLYGGRGITMCEEWKSSFEVFLRDMGKKPQMGMQLDRIDPDGNYEPGNCRWATPQENGSNRRNSSKYRGIYLYIKKERLCDRCKSLS